MEQLRDGLWHWTLPHPAWEPSEDWPELVGCFAYDGGEGLVLIDPLVSGDWSSVDALAESHGGVASVAVTVRWHARDSGAAAERYGAGLFAPTLGKEQESLASARALEDGTRIPGGVEALLVPEAWEALLWLEGARTLVGGDVLLARDGRLSVCPDSWFDSGPQDAAPAKESLRRALDLPLDAVAVSHGDPVLFEGREALEAALRD